MYRFRGLGCGHLWKVILLPAMCGETQMLPTTAFIATPTSTEKDNILSFKRNMRSIHGSRK